MLRSSFSLGRVLGVEVRAHVSLLLLLFLAVGYSVATSSNTVRGVGLWLTLCLAVLVREGARVLAALYAGMPLRGILLLPVGGVFALAPRGDGTAPQTGRSVTLAGPIANMLVGVLLLGLVLSLVPGVVLLRQPWIGTHHLLRSLIWMQVLLGAVGLLPPNLLPTRSLLGVGEERTPQGGRGFASLGGAMGILLLLLGFSFVSPWLIVMGGLLLLLAQVRAARPVAQGNAGTLRARDAMLRDYVVLSSSDTFQSALDRAAQTLQDTFPVLRGEALVGSISRSVIARHLRFEGDGYLQSAMNRVIETAAPDEPVAGALQRAAVAGAGDLLPVVENRVVLGILTPQSVARAAQGRRFSRVAASAESSR